MKGYDWLMAQNDIELFREDMRPEYMGLVGNGYLDAAFGRGHGPYVALEYANPARHERVDYWIRRSEEYVSLNLERLRLTDTISLWHRTT